MLFFSPAIFAGRCHIEADYLNWFYPWRYSAVGGDSGSCTFLKNTSVQDPLLIYYPMDCLFNQMLKKGSLLLWNPYNFCGHPLQAIGHPSMVYPPRMLFHYLFSPIAAREVLLFIHLFLAGLFSYRYLRLLELSKFSSLTGGVVWMLAGFPIVYLPFEYVTMIAAHIPLALYFVERLVKTGSFKHCAALALVIGSAVLVGHWQFVIYALLIIGPYAIFRVLSMGCGSGYGSFRRTALLTFFSIVLGLSVAAVQLLPSMELFSLSHRPIFTLTDLFAASRFLPENLLTLFHPDILGHPSHHFYLTRIRSGTQNYRDLCCYVGFLPLFLGLWGALQKKGVTLIFTLLALLSLLYAMGAPIVNLLYYILPGFKNFTPCRTLFIFTFCMAMLSAFGVERIEREGMPLKLVRAFLVFCSVFTMAIAVLSFMVQTNQAFLRGLLAFYASGSLFIVPNYCIDRVAFVGRVIESLISHYTLTDLFLLMPLLLGWCGFAIFNLKRKGMVNEKIFRFLILLIVSIDLLYFGMKFNATFPRGEVYPSCSGISYLAGKGSTPYRVAGLIRMAHPDSLLYYGIYDVAGYASIFPRDYARFITALAGEEQSYLMLDLHDGKGYRKPMADFLNVRYHYTDPLRTIDSERGRLVYDADLRVYENQGYLPRFFIVPMAIVEKDRKKILEMMLSDRFEPSRKVYLEEEPEVRGEDGAEGKAEIITYSPQYIKIQVTNNAQAFIVESDTYYPGWEAFINGKKVRLYRANYCFRALSVPPGEHTVELFFRPAPFHLGILISSVSVIMCLLIICWRRKD
jgi:hypothetical protein